MKPNNPRRTRAKKIARGKLEQFDLAIDAVLGKSGIARVDKPEYDRLYNQVFVRDIVKILMGAPDNQTE
jgi:hypothetical protein